MRCCFGLEIHILCFGHAALFLDGLVVMIRLSHSRERGSIPRRGKHHFFAILAVLRFFFVLA